MVIRRTEASQKTDIARKERANNGSQAPIKRSARPIGSSAVESACSFGTWRLGACPAAGCRLHCRPVRRRREVPEHAAEDEAVKRRMDRQWA